MSQHNFDTDSLSNSSSIAKSFADSLVPIGGKEIKGTTTASRGYANQTLVSTDLISAASGKELLASGVYSNMFNLNMTRESLGSLARSVFTETDNLTLTETDEDGQNTVYKRI
jgi:hypothetical protein